MEASFERERRFSSHAAHELRTPLAELRMVAELGATWPDQATPERCREMIKVVDELEALLEKLFERFWRKDPSHLAEAHSGLGLSIVRACVGLLDGTIQPSLSEDGIFQVEIIWPERC